MKEEEILEYSNPKEVFKKAKDLLGDDVKIKISTRKNKKYMFYDDENDKWIHFGQMGYEDYTKHHDEQRRRAFMIRNRHWIKNDNITPGKLALFLLW